MLSQAKVVNMPGWMLAGRVTPLSASKSLKTRVDNHIHLRIGQVVAKSVGADHLFIPCQ